MKKILLGLIILILLGCKSSHDTTIQKWKKGIIPYKFGSHMTYTQMAEIRLAMNEWEKSGVVEFKYTPIIKDHHKTDVYEIILANTVGRSITCKGEKVRFCSASSSVGYSPYRNRMMIVNCFRRETILHELGHALGLQHEHQRPDRDKYIKILWENISKKGKSQFELLYPEEFIIPYNAFEYDYESIMHYSKTAYTNTCDGNTIESDHELRGDKISEIDIKKVQYIYGVKK